MNSIISPNIDTRRKRLPGRQCLRVSPVASRTGYMISEKQMERKKPRTLAQCLGYYNSYLKQTYVHVPECVCIWQRLKRWAFALNWYMLHLILDGGG